MQISPDAMALLQASLDCIIIMDQQGRILEFNPAAERTFDYHRDKIIGCPLAETIIPPRLRQAHKAGLAHYLATGEGPVLGQRLELTGMRRDGTEFPAELAIVPMHIGDFSGFTAFLRDISGRRASEEEQVRLASTNRLLLDSTGDGIYGINRQGDFTFVNQTALEMLGYTENQILGRNGHALIHHHRPDGTHYAEEDCPIFHALRNGEVIRVEDDVFWRQNRTAFPVSYSASPIVADGVVQGAAVTFTDISERLALSKEHERLTEREHRIAEQLQEALQPAVPSSIPGMTLANYYRPALEEAGVGGDFSDVFPADEHKTFLVVGDLSGKGLAAASQVATVRNMLRFALYNGRTLVGPVMRLNETLAVHGLLSGFATLFVGCYDAALGTLTYVNCGQDAGLIRRVATGLVEPLPPTGPILGGMEGAIYTEETVSLQVGDALALFTDGLTEAGPTRTELLTGDGVGELLQAQSGLGSAPEIVDALMTGVNAYAQGGVRDDQCLLVGVVSTLLKENKKNLVQ